MRYHILELPITATGFDTTVWTFAAQRGTPIPDKGRPTGKSEYRNKSYPLFLTVESDYVNLNWLRCGGPKWPQRRCMTSRTSRR